ncbi:hypothetical protein AM353_10850 [Providencia stuartii]|nr:hypothetical protein AM353_10850 [Providencia stuartii]
MRNGGLYFRFFHYILLVSLLVGCMFFAKTIVEIYWPQMMVPGVGWYYVGIRPGRVLFPVIGLGLFAVLFYLYRYFGVLMLTVSIVAGGIVFFVLNSL